jgi:hypothetical protein
MTRAQQFLNPLWGAVPAFLPSDLAGLQLWLDAQDMNGNGDGNSGWSDTDAAALWVDKAGIGNATQSTADNKPAYRTAIINGYPVVRFDGTDDYMDLGNNFSIDNTVTFFVVYSNNKSARQTIFGQQNTVGALAVEFGSTSPNRRVAMMHGVYVAGTGDPAQYPSSPELLVYRRTGAGAGTHTIRVNGATQSLGTDAENSWAVDGTKELGRRAAGSQPLGADLAELIIYSGALSDAEILQVEAYLNSKWGL